MHPFLPLFSNNPMRHFYRYGNGMNGTHGNWVYLQCAKWGRVTFGKESLESIFTTTERNLLKQLKDYCAERKLRMRVDSTNSLFTFQMKGNRTLQLR